MRVTIYLKESQLEALYSFFRKTPQNHGIEFSHSRKDTEQVRVSLSYTDYEILKLWRSEHSDEGSIINS
jgi:hypothetical protein